MNGFGALGQFALGEAQEGSATTTIYGITYKFTNPVQFPKRLNAALNTPFFWNPTTPGIQISWFAPLSEPVRVPKRLPAPENLFQSEAPIPQPFFNMAWVQPLSEPKRFPKALPPGEALFFASNEEPPEQDDMAWFKPFSEPKRFPQRLDASNNPSFVRGTSPFYRATARAYVIT